MVTEPLALPLTVVLEWLLVLMLTWEPWAKAVPDTANAATKKIAESAIGKGEPDFIFILHGETVSYRTHIGTDAVAADLFKVFRSVIIDSR